LPGMMLDQVGGNQPQSMPVLRTPPSDLAASGAAGGSMVARPLVPAQR
jgi:hypothetical protein